jgi:glycerol-3-phosphate dehydrogenase (NAD(P)+)
MKKLAVLGAGAWGTALAVHLAGMHAVRLWARDPEFAAMLRRESANARYLPGVHFPETLRIESDLAEALRGAECLILAMTVAGLRGTLQQLRTLAVAVPVIWLCKGFERPQAKLPHEVFAEVMAPDHPHAVLSGPSFAQEVAAGLPAALTLASASQQTADALARVLHGGTLRVYSHDDVVGVEVGGAVKNVMAIAAGVCDGFGLGLNARAALITRGLAEMTRLGVALGARSETFMGLAGIGDLILTCTGDLSRNRRVGLALAQGQTLAGVQAGLGHVAEGVFTAAEVQRRARMLGVDTPITDAVCRVLEQPGRTADVVRELLARDARSEHGQR